LRRIKRCAATAYLATYIGFAFEMSLRPRLNSDYDTFLKLRLPDLFNFTLETVHDLFLLTASLEGREFITLTNSELSVQ